MSRINCHSAFKHYEMFHSQGGDVINIGSNNTTIFNMGTGFGGGSFWSGLGYGLGNGLGSIFGGFFGGNMGSFGNFGFGTSPFGMGGFGNFGFGMSPFGSGNIWGGGSNRVDSSSDGKGKVKDSKDDKHGCDDPDRKIINDLGSKVKDTIGNKDAKPADVKALYEKIKKAKTESEKEPNHTETDKKDYENMLGTLKNYANEKGWGDLDGDNFGIDGEKTVDNTDGNKPVVHAPAADGNVENANFDNKLKEAGNDKNKLLALINDPSLTPEERAKAKAKYAETFGYTNYDGKDTINKDNMKLVTDTGLGSKADITTFVEVKQEAGSHPTEITMETKYSKTKVTYKYVGVVDGEYIYESQAGKGQQYALQKNSNGYALVEYAYHKGFDDPDVK